MGVDPLAVLLDLCKDPDKEIRLAAAKDVCKYIYSAKRDVQVSTAPGQPLEIQSRDLNLVDELEKLIQTELSELKNIQGSKKEK